MKIFYNVIIICFLCFNIFAKDKMIKENELHVLILGGNSFLGPHLTNELLNNGHKVTHFNRGNECYCSFPEVEKLKGNRDGNLNALEGRKWDAVIDTSGYLPRIVEASSKILSKESDHYTFISTISVYESFNERNIDENFALAKLDNNEDEKITDVTYGPLKARCEKVVKDYFPDNSLIIRPGLIVGPYDTTDRFTYWVRRIAEAGKVIIPDNPKQKLQIIDVRDLSKWIVKMIEEKAIGTYNATGPKEDLTFEKFVLECSKFAKKKLDLIWIDEKHMIDMYVDNWNKFPLCLSSKSNNLGIFSINSKKAQDKGLSYRSLSETILDTLNWDDKRIDRKIKTGLSNKEEEILIKQISDFDND